MENRLTLERFNALTGSRYVADGANLGIIAAMSEWDIPDSDLEAFAAEMAAEGYGGHKLRRFKSWYQVRYGIKAPRKARDPRPAPAPLPEPDPAPIPAPTPAPAPAGNGLASMTLQEVFGGLVTRADLDEERVRDIIREELAILPAAEKLEVTIAGETREVEGITHPKYAQCLKLILKGRSPYLYGDAGTGKNHLCEQLASGLGLRYTCVPKVLMDYDLMGYVDANGQYVETAFYDYYKNGGLLLLDEMDASAPEALIKINEGLANTELTFPCGRVKRHPDFHLVGAGNTLGNGADDMYSARSVLDLSTLDRFFPVTIDYDRRVEMSIANGDEELVDFIEDFRQAVKSCGIRAVVSYRAIQNFVALENEAEFTVEDIIDGALIRGKSRDDVNMISSAMTTYNNRYTLALRGMIA